MASFVGCLILVVKLPLTSSPLIPVTMNGCSFSRRRSQVMMSHEAGGWNTVVSILFLKGFVFADG